MRNYLFVWALMLPFAACCGEAAVGEPCRIDVVDKENGWPVPLVELRTNHEVRFVSDNAGRIALDLPELMGRETWFDVIGHGYEVPRDGFGSRGVRITPEPGKAVRVEVARTNVAKRLGRLTGAGLFGESRKLGLESEGRDGPILGCDSIQGTRYGDRLFWAWGDTKVAHYKLGLFEMTGATTPIGPLASLDPPLRPTFEFFKGEQGRVRAIARTPGKGPTWLTGFVSLPDRNGREHLMAIYRKIEGHLTIYEIGICEWNDEKQTFEPKQMLWERGAVSPGVVAAKPDAAESNEPDPLFAEGHAAFATDDTGKRWVYFGNPLPTRRHPATYEAYLDRSTWEALEPQKQLAAAGGKSGAEGKGAVKPHSGSIAYNEFRKRWVTVFMEHFGKPSAFGELWYAEADAPTGPWGPCVKVLTHENYTFYNPRIDFERSPAGSPVLLFEGTYTAEFANHPQRTPRYDYNQILYRLDLDDPRLKPARHQLDKK
jgi:hypothetical protein